VLAAAGDAWSSSGRALATDAAPIKNTAAMTVRRGIPATFVGELGNQRHK